MTPELALPTLKSANPLRPTRKDEEAFRVLEQLAREKGWVQ